MNALPSAVQRIASTQPWYERMPVRSRQILLWAVSGIVLLVFLSAAIFWYLRSQPAYVLKVLGDIDSLADVRANQAYFTPQGEVIVLWMLEKQGGKPASGNP